MLPVWDLSLSVNGLILFLIGVKNTDNNVLHALLNNGDDDDFQILFFRMRLLRLLKQKELVLCGADFLQLCKFKRVCVCVCVCLCVC